MCRPTCRLAAVLVLMAATVAAQISLPDWETVKLLSTGTEIRIVTGSRTVRGDLIRATDDTLVVASGKGQETFAHQQVSDVSIRKKEHRARNMLIGLGVGAGTGAVAGAIDDANCHGFLCGGHLSTTVGGVLGALVGTIVGAVWPSGGWREIYKK